MATEEAEADKSMVQSMVQSMPMLQAVVDLLESKMKAKKTCTHTDP